MLAVGQDIDDSSSSHVPYPEGIKSPKVELNVNVKGEQISLCLQ
jgi:hypothetical protein